MRPLHVVCFPLHNGVRDCGRHIQLVVDFHPGCVCPHQFVRSIHIVRSLGLADAHFSPPPDVAVIFSTRIPLPCFQLSPLAGFLAEKKVIKPRKASCRRRYFPVDFKTIPVFAVLLLLATRCIDRHDLRLGIIGDGGVQPPSIMALFLSLVTNTPPMSAVESLTRPTGLHDNFPRRRRAVQVSRVLGG